MKLSPEAEEVATFFAKMLDHEYTTKDIFRKNFFKDWRKVGEMSHHNLLNKVLTQRSVLKDYCFFECDVFFLVQEMNAEEKAKITDLKKCNFAEMSEYFKAQSEARKAKSKDEKLVSSWMHFQILHV